MQSEVSILKVKEVNSKGQTEDFELLFTEADDFLEQLNVLTSKMEEKE